MSAGTVSREVTLERSIDAPRKLVWQAWTEPRHMAQWWGPRHFTNPVCEMDVRIGGEIRIDMRGPDGTVYPMTGSFRELVEPECLVLTTEARDGAGRAHLAGVSAVTFRERGRQTLLTVRSMAIGISPQAPQMLADGCRVVAEPGAARGTGYDAMTAVEPAIVSSP